MPRSHTILQNQFPYHVTGRSINREWFSLPIEQVWQIMSDQLYYIWMAHGAEIHSFVLMSNHFHLLVSTPDGNLSQIMANFMKETSRQLSTSANRINQTYGARHFRSVIASPRYFLHAYKYVYLNPVRAGLVTKVEDYPYSTLAGLLGRRRMIIPMVEDTTLFGDIQETLNWLNQRPSEESWLAVKRALRHRTFYLSKDRSNKKANPLEFNAL